MTRLAYDFPPELESCIETLRHGLSPAALARAVAKLSAFFTSHRGARPEDYLADPDSRAAYLAYFLPANYSKLEAVFDEMKPQLVEQVARKRSDDQRPFRVLDVGAGPGTMTLAALEYLHALSPDGGFHFSAVDPNREMLKICRHLFHCLRDRIGIEERRAGLKTLAASIQEMLARPAAQPDLHGLFDIIILANVWNELADSGPMSLLAQVSLIRGLLDQLEFHGSLILIEPALRESSRTLHQLHNAVLELIAGANVFAPCVHQRACPCVAAGNRKDWCHTEFEWRPPRQVTAIDQIIGNRKDALKFSYLVLRKDGKNVLDVNHSSMGLSGLSACWRMVSELIVEKGKRRAFLCGESGRFQFTRLDRHEGPANRAFGDLTRGDIVKIRGAESRDEDWRLTDATVVERI
ncbi:MAG: small ribosomal subunit Rsm22 family protein [Acidobacteriia bacterium]|nr:small ribosomal subunit Rsm22 family protein [Terriglobia bacterium]